MLLADHGPCPLHQKPAEAAPSEVGPESLEGTLDQAGTQELVERFFVPQSEQF